MAKIKRYYDTGKIVFITMVTHNRQPVLVKNIDLVVKALKSLKYKFKILAYAVLYDHIHVIIEQDDLKNTPQIVGFFKADFTKNYKVAEGLPSEYKIKIWQNSYYDHIIRNEYDLYRHIDYIHFNPEKHYNIAPIDWKYSSFNNFLKRGYYDKNWCNFYDKYDIIKLDLE